MPTRTRADAQRNRTAILEAAARLFESSEQASIADVADAAGLTRTTVYRHFPDRDALVDALLVHVATATVPTLLSEMERAPLEDALALLAQGVLQLAHEHHYLVSATAHRIEEAARTAVDDEPIARLLSRHADRLVPGADVDWLARCVRTLCLTAVADTRPRAEVAADLTASLRRLVLA